MASAKAVLTLFVFALILHAPSVFSNSSSLFDDPTMEMRVQLQENFKSYINSMNEEDFITAAMYLPECQFAQASEEQIVMALEQASLMVKTNMGKPIVIGAEYYEFGTIWYARLDIRVKMTITFMGALSKEEAIRYRDSLAELYGASNVEMDKDNKSFKVTDAGSYYALYEHMRWKYFKSFAKTDACLPAEVSDAIGK